MLTDAKLKSLKGREKPYKVSDRDGLYVMVAPTGRISFRYNYHVNGRYETLTLGRYGPDGLTLAAAREALMVARKTVSEGRSPARVKEAAKSQRKSDEKFDVWAQRWLEKHRMSESTRAMRRWTYEHDLKERFGTLLLSEISEQLLRSLCEKIVERGAPAVAVHAREIVLMVFRYADSRGEKHANPAEKVLPSSIATFLPRERSLTPNEIKIFYKYLELVQCAPTIRLACKMLLLTMVRRSELTDATWAEIDFSSAVWAIPGARMKRRNPHHVYLSTQVMDILVALKTCAGSSRFIFPSRDGPDRPMNGATLNRVLAVTIATANEAGCFLSSFSPHDFRRTSSTLLHEAGYNTDWIEKCLAHEQKGVRAVYNRAEYAQQRRSMLQDWANLIDQWTSEES